MRILIYGINYWPELVGIGKYTGELAEWLAKRGHAVSVVTAPPHYPQWRIQPGYSAWRFCSEQLHGVRVLRCPVWLPNKLTALQRMIHLLSFALSSFIPVLGQAIRFRPDVILAIEPPLFCAPISALAAKVSGAASWLHVQDFELDAAFELGLMQRPAVHRWVERLERWLMRRFTRVSTLSEAMTQRLTEKGVDPAKQKLVPNWVDTDKIFPTENDPAWRSSRLGVSGDEFTVLYSGSMGRKQGLEILIEAARLLQGQSQIRFIICGEGPMRATLEKLSETLSNVSLLPLQPNDDFNNFLNAADLHVIVQRSQGQRCFMPSKLATIMANGRPVLAVTESDSPVATVLLNCGQVVPPGDGPSLARAILELSTQPPVRKRLGDEARRYACQHWSKERVLEAFEKMLGSVSTRSRPLSPLDNRPVG